MMQAPSAWSGAGQAVKGRWGGKPGGAFPLDTGNRLGEVKVQQRHSLSQLSVASATLPHWP